MWKYGKLQGMTSNSSVYTEGGKYRYKPEEFLAFSHPKKLK